jgi:outer membrane protein TolC
MKQILKSIKKISILVVGMLYLCFSPLLIDAQVGEQVDLGEEGFNPITDDITKKIPTLEVLIESAMMNSHRIRYWDKQIKLSEYNLKTTKRDWARYFSFSGSIQEGSWTSLSMVEDQLGNSIGTLGTTDQTRWSVGLVVRVPLINLIDYKNQTNIAKVEIESKIEEKLEEKRGIRAQVITLYNELVIQQKMLQLDIDNIEYQTLTTEMAEKEYEQNKISLTDMARVNDELSMARGRYVTTKINFINTYVMLQEITGVKFSELNNWE